MIIYMKSRSEHFKLLHYLQSCCTGTLLLEAITAVSEPTSRQAP